jgi:synaptojanin
MVRFILFAIVLHNSSPHSDIFLALVTSAIEVGNTRPSGKKSETVARIHEVSFYSLTSSTWDDLSVVSDGLLSPDGIMIDPINRETYVPPGAAPPVFEHPCMPLTKILSSGSFYYALDSPWDLSSRLSVRLSRDPTSAKDIGTFDERFVWNEYIVRSLLDFRERLDVNDREDLDNCQFIVRH